MFTIPKESAIYVAGHNGLVGSGVWRALTTAGYTNLIGWRSAEIDLTDRTSTIAAITEAKPDVVIMAAAKVGGIVANNSYPVEFLQDNVRIQTNVFEALTMRLESFRVHRVHAHSERALALLGVS